MFFYFSFLFYYNLDTIHITSIRFNILFYTFFLLIYDNFSFNTICTKQDAKGYKENHMFKNKIVDFRIIFVKSSFQE